MLSNSPPPTVDPLAQVDLPPILPLPGDDGPGGPSGRAPQRHVPPLLHHHLRTRLLVHDVGGNCGQMSRQHKLLAIVSI